MSRYVVGLTGGIAAGKSEVTRRFEALGIVVADADLADAGVIFGTGFAPFTGGPLHYEAGSTKQDRSTAARAD